MFVFFRALLVICLLSPVVARAAEISAVIDGKSNVAAGGSIFLDGTKSSSDYALDWQMLKGTGFFTTFDKGMRESVVLFMPAPEPGLYRFALIAVGTPTKSGERPVVKVAVFEVLVGDAPAPTPPPPGPNPPPNPDPPVPPDPGPTPNPVVTGKVWATYVVDPVKITLDQAALLASSNLKSGLNGLGIYFRAYTIDSPELIAKKLDIPAKSAGLPVTIFQNEKGQVLLAVTGSNETSILNAAKKLRGK